MTKSKTTHKAHAFSGAAALITAALLTAILFTACPNTAGGGGAGTGGGGSSTGSLEGVWKALSMTTVVGGMTTTGNFPAPYEDPDDASNTDATMQLYMCFYEGKMYMAAKYNGMSNPAKNGLFLNVPGAPYNLSGNTLSVGTDTFIVSFPSAGSLELKMTKGGTDTTMQLEKTSDYTAEQIKNAPPEE